MKTAICLTQIHKRFGNKPILKGINLQINRGEILGLLGPNGAGKSTLIKIMTGLLQPDSGRIDILGHQFNHNQQTLRKQMGFAPQSLGIYPQLTARQNLVSFGSINGLSRLQIREKICEVNSMFDLKTFLDRKAGNLSGGQKRRPHSAIALMNNAKIIFLDEPTVGADINSRNHIIQAVKNLASHGTTIVYTTHYLQEMEALDAHIAFLNGGKIQTEGSLKAIISEFAQTSIKLYFNTTPPNGLPDWQQKDNYLVSTNSHPTMLDAQSLQEVLSNPNVSKLQLTDIKIFKANLESAYQSLLKKGRSDEN